MGLCVQQLLLCGPQDLVRTLASLEMGTALRWVPLGALCPSEGGEMQCHLRGDLISM